MLLLPAGGWPGCWCARSAGMVSAVAAPGLVHASVRFLVSCRSSSPASSSPPAGSDRCWRWTWRCWLSRWRCSWLLPFPPARICSRCWPCSVFARRRSPGLRWCIVLRRCWWRSEAPEHASARHHRRRRGWWWRAQLAAAVAPSPPAADDPRAPQARPFQGFGRSRYSYAAPHAAGATTEVHPCLAARHPHWLPATLVLLCLLQWPSRSPSWWWLQPPAWRALGRSCSTRGRRCCCSIHGALAAPGGARLPPIAMLQAGVLWLAWPSAWPALAGVASGRALAGRRFGPASQHYAFTMGFATTVTLAMVTRGQRPLAVHRCRDAPCPRCSLCCSSLLQRGGRTGRRGPACARSLRSPSYWRCCSWACGCSVGSAAAARPLSHVDGFCSGAAAASIPPMELLPPARHGWASVVTTNEKKVTHDHRSIADGNLRRRTPGLHPTPAFAHHGIWRRACACSARAALQRQGGR